VRVFTFSTLSLLKPTNQKIKKKKKDCLKVLTQLGYAEIARSDVVTRVRAQDLTVVCEFYFNGLQLHLKPERKKKIKPNKPSDG